MAPASKGQGGLCQGTPRADSGARWAPRRCCHIGDTLSPCAPHSRAHRVHSLIAFPAASPGTQRHGRQGMVSRAFHHTLCTSLPLHPPCSPRHATSQSHASDARRSPLPAVRHDHALPGSSCAELLLRHFRAAQVGPGEIDKGEISPRTGRPPPGPPSRGWPPWRLLQPEQRLAYPPGPERRS